MTHEPPKLCYSPTEAAAALGISKTSYYRLLRKGEFKTFRMLGMRFVQAEDLQAFIARMVAANDNEHADNDNRGKPNQAVR